LRVAGEPLVDQTGRGDEPRPQVQRRVDRGDGVQREPRIERAGQRRDEQRVLVREDAEDGPLGDARGLRDLPGADIRTVLTQQGDRRGDQGRTPFLGRQSRHPPAALTLDRRHEARLVSEHSLSH
jgi:hypothetical protein